MLSVFSSSTGIHVIFDFTVSVNTPPTIKYRANTTYVAGYSKNYVVITLGRPNWKDDKKGVRQVIILMQLSAK